MTLAIGAAGGALAAAVGAPLPWLLGGLLATAAAAARGVRLGCGGLYFPAWARLVCVPVIGVLIGGAFKPEVLSEAAAWWPGLLAVLLFVLVAHGVNYALFRRAGLSKPTAFFAGMPGGLVESVELGGEAGADLRALTVLQFARIAVVVTAIPLMFSALVGHAVGSAGGARFDAGAPLTFGDALLLAATGAAGYFGARAIKAPASQILGPIVASAAVHAAGITEAAPPSWLVAVAQLVIGVTLGLRFEGVEPAALRRYLGLSALSVGAMFAIGGVLAAALAAGKGIAFSTMILSLAPGGVVEMGLIALSLEASPLFVTACHLLRIVVTVGLGVAMWRRLSR